MPSNAVAGVQPCRCVARVSCSSRDAAARLRRRSSRRPAILITFFRRCRRPIRSRPTCCASTKPRGAGFRPATLERAEREFQAVLKRSPQFYPSETALGYLRPRAQELRAGARAVRPRAAVARATTCPRWSAAVKRCWPSRARPTRWRRSRPRSSSTRSWSTSGVGRSAAGAGRRRRTLRRPRRAAQANRLDEAAQLYEKALAASPDSAFLVRDLADVEAKQGKTDEALARYRRAIELDPSDAGVADPHRRDARRARRHRGRDDACTPRPPTLEPSAELRRRMAALEARLAYLRLPAEYRAIPKRPAITRGDLASLIGIRLAPLLSAAPAQPVVITDARNHWASNWIMAVAQARRHRALREPHVSAGATPVEREAIWRRPSAGC